MSTSLATEVRCRLRWLLEETAELTAATDNAELEYERATAEGTGAGQANRIWRTQATLGPAGVDEWELSDLPTALLGGSGTIAMENVKTIVLRNLSAAGGDLLRLSSGATQPWTALFGGAAGSIDVGPDGCLVVHSPVDGWDVAAGSADRLRVRNPGGGTIEYQLVVVGEETA